MASNQATDKTDKLASQFQFTIEMSQEAIFWLERSGQFSYVNAQACRSLGYTDEELLSLFLWDIDPDFPKERWDVHWGNLATVGTRTFETRHRRKDGLIFPVEVCACQIVFDGNEFHAAFVRDITERKATETALLKSEQLFRDFFESNPTATIISSPSGMVHMTNAAFTRTTGFSAEEVVGRNSQELGFWRDPEARQTMIKAIREHGFINNLESDFFGKGGLPMTCLISSRAIEHEGEMRILSTVVDVTLQREVERKMRKLDQDKSDFIAIAAHELRTPLAAIFGYAELLEDAAQLGISAQQRQSYSSIILNNAEILSRLTDDLLDVEQIQLDRPFRLTREKTSLSKLIKETLASFTLKCPDHRFILVHANILPEAMWIDSVRITQVLSNLFDNAVKYSPEGRVVEVTTETDEKQINISIKDKGVGMTSEEVGQIFHRFYRAKSLNIVTQGLGLGMCIVKRIVEDHGGEIYVTSFPGEGTTVTFTLPIKKPLDTETRE
jgi:PAS domain S-box-containing protein